MNFNTSNFTYNKETKTFVAEVSDLWYIGLWQSGSSMLTITGKRHTVRYNHTSTNTDREGEITGWHFTPHPDDNEIAAGTSVLIIND